MIVEPYTFVRAITLGLGTAWTLGGLVRMARFGVRWQQRLVPLGLTDAWLRKQVLLVALRTTVLDPINLALLLLLLASWTLRALVT